MLLYGPDNYKAVFLHILDAAKYQRLKASSGHPRSLQDFA